MVKVNLTLLSIFCLCDTNREIEMLFLTIYRNERSHDMLFWLLPVPFTRPLVCYVALYACKRSAESQTLKVHRVASKTLTQKRPVYAAPERLVGNFSFSIFFFLVMVTKRLWGLVTLTQPYLFSADFSADFRTHTLTACSG